MRRIPSELSDNWRECNVRYFSFFLFQKLKMRRKMSKMSREQTFNFAVWSSFIHSLKNFRLSVFSGSCALYPVHMIYSCLSVPSLPSLVFSLHDINSKKEKWWRQWGAEEARLSSVRDEAKRHSRWGWRRETLSHHLENERMRGFEELFGYLLWASMSFERFFEEGHLLTLEEWGGK